MLRHVTPQQFISSPQTTLCFIQFSICFALPVEETVLSRSLAIFHLEKKFATFMDTLGSLPCSQETATSPSDPRVSAHTSTLHFLKTLRNIVSPSRICPYLTGFYGLKLYVRILSPIKRSLYMKDPRYYSKQNTYKYSLTQPTRL